MLNVKRRKSENESGLENEVGTNEDPEKEISGNPEKESGEFGVIPSERTFGGIDENDATVLPDVLKDSSELPSSGFRPTSGRLSGNVSTKELVEVLKTTQSKEVELLGIFFDKEILGHLSAAAMKQYSRDRLSNLLTLVKLDKFEDRDASEKWLRQFRSRSHEGAKDEYDLMSEVMEAYEEWRLEYLKANPKFYAEWKKWFALNNGIKRLN